MRLIRPLYELLPYFYALAGLLVVAMAFRLSDGSDGATFFFVVGYVLIIFGVVLWLKRRGYRRTRRRENRPL